MRLSKEQMLKVVSEIDPFYIEMLMRIHPIFDRCLSVVEAGAELGISKETSLKVWKEFLEKYPMVKKTIRDHTNPKNVDKDKLRNPLKCGDLMSIEFSEDDSVFGSKIVEKF